MTTSKKCCVIIHWPEGGLTCTSLPPQLKHITHYLAMITSTILISKHSVSIDGSNFCHMMGFTDTPILYTLSFCQTQLLSVKRFIGRKISLLLPIHQHNKIGSISFSICVHIFSNEYVKFYKNPVWNYNQISVEIIFCCPYLMQLCHYPISMSWWEKIIIIQVCPKKWKFNTNCYLRDLSSTKYPHVPEKCQGNKHDTW